MQQRSYRRLIILACSFILLLVITVYPQPLPPEDVKEEIFKAYTSIVDAYNSGGNVTRLIAELNNAIEMVNSNRTLEAYMIASSVREYASSAKIEGLERQRLETLMIIFFIVIIAFISAIIYLYGPRLYWRLWVKLRGKYKVVFRRSKVKRYSMLISEEVWAVILAVIVVASVFAISQLYIAGRVIEPFSELGILGSKKKIGDYPRELFVGEKALLHIYVGNHMGVPMYYIVQVKIGNSTTPIDPAPIEPILTFEKVLPHNSTWIFPLTISFNETGLNYRIIVELWIYNYTTHRIEYHHRWGQIWVNVTSPIPP